MLKPLHLSAQRSKLFIVTMNEPTLHQRVCTVDRCGRKLHGHGLCRHHYNRTYKAIWFANAVNSLIRHFHNKYYYRMPGVSKRATERARSDKNKKYRREYMRRNCSQRMKIGLMASSAVRKAIRRGDITRGDCEVCGKSGGGRIVNAHHDSYMPDKWLTVRWLCTKHHGEWHRANNPIYPDHI